MRADLASISYLRRNRRATIFFSTRTDWAVLTDGFLRIDVGEEATSAGETERGFGEDLVRLIFLHLDRSLGSNSPEGCMKVRS